MTSRTVLTDIPKKAAPSKVPAKITGRNISLIVLCSAMLMIILDGTIVTVALPTIQNDLGLSSANLGWIVNAYLVPFGGLLMLAGRLGDLFGRKRIFTLGLTIFTLASLACGLAGSGTALIASRVVQGIGGALASAVILGMIVTLFPEPGKQARAIGVYSFVGAAGASLGLVLGGTLTQAINWHWIFFVNVPIGVLAIAFSALVLQREDGIGFDGHPDIAGTLMLTSALTLGVYAITEVSNYGWLSMYTAGFGLLSAVLLALFVRHEARVNNPLVPLRIFAIANVWHGNLIQLLVISGMFGQQFYLALRFQNIFGYSPTMVGLAMAPIAVAIGFSSLILSGRLLMRFGVKPVLMGSLAVMAAGLAVFSQLGEHANYWLDVFPTLIVVGLGAGVSMPAMMGTAMSGVPSNDAGLASGLFNTSQQIACALGLAILSTFATSRTASLTADGASHISALASGYGLAFGIAGGLVFAGLIATGVLLRKTPSQKA